VSFAGSNGDCGEKTGSAIRKRGQPFNIDILSVSGKRRRYAEASAGGVRRAMYHVMARGDRREAIVRDDDGEKGAGL